jgi:DNA-binding transcriptional LysR family regulator
METLADLEAFVRSAKCGSFSKAARRLSLTPAAVNRNVAILERNLGVRLFHWPAPIWWPGFEVSASSVA